MIRLFQAMLYHYGPAILAKYTTPCAWLILALCLCAALFDFTRSRRFDALLWVAMGILLWIAFWFESTLYSPAWSEAFAIAAATLGTWLLGKSLVQLLRFPAADQRL